MSTFKVDLTNCDQEPIHIPGRIQGHGFLIGVSSTTHLVHYISDNATHFLNTGAGSFLGKHIVEVETSMNISKPEHVPTISNLIILGAGNGFQSINPFYMEISGKGYNLILTTSNNIYLLEFEPCELDKKFDVQKTIGLSISEILLESGLPSLLKSAARQIKKIIEFDRVMVYKFDDEGHGHVIAEEKNDDLESFLGLHYPASDIPKQARELYKINLTRIIADVQKECPDILTYMGNAVPLDLTHSVLRAVSPIHIQYLKNMGVRSSFSISLLSHGELWGLVACHNYSPKFIDYKARDASKLIGQILFPALEYRLGEEDSQKFEQVNAAVNELVRYAEKDNDLVKALTGNQLTINDLCSATGCALVYDHDITSMGATPGTDQIQNLAQWIVDNCTDSVYYTHQLPAVFPAAREYSHLASGIFAVILSKERTEMILFFKPEQTEVVHWAGNPDKAVLPASNGELPISPRKSFATWTEVIKHSSEKWSRAETAALINLREQLAYQINRNTNELQRLNARLELAQAELDMFSLTVSHDLRTPLTTIKGYTEVLLHTNQNLDDNAKGLLGKINFCADKMSFLLKEVLRYSSYSRTEIKPGRVDMSRLIEDVRAELEISTVVNSVVVIVSSTPPLYGDAAMIEQAFSNIIGNAVKYSSRSSNPVVRIEGHIAGKNIIYSVSDNGIGIDKKYHSRIFELFQRLDNAKDYDGTGVGLAIVKRIVERHEGQIWFESEPGQGTTFFLRFKNETPHSGGFKEGDRHFKRDIFLP